MVQRKVIGLLEHVRLIGAAQCYEDVVARIDTGAMSSSIDIKIAKDLHFPIISGLTKTIRSANGETIRKVVQATLEIQGKKISAKMSITDRSHMTYPLLIGRDILTQEKFIIDPLVEFDSKKKVAVKK